MGGEENTLATDREQAIQAFLSNGWTVKENAGEEDVNLTKTDGDET